MIAFLKDIAPGLLYFSFLIVFFLCLSGRVKYGLLFLIPLIPLQNVIEKIQQFPMGKDFNDILLLGMLIGWFVINNSRGQRLLDKSPYNKLLFFYLIFTYISLWQGSSYLGYPAPLNPLDERVQSWKNYMVFLLLFFISFNNLKNKNELKKLFTFMCLSIFLMNYYLIAQISWMGSWVSREKINGTFVWLGANEVAAFYATYTFVLLGIFLIIKEKNQRIMLLILILQNLYCNLFLFSRGAYLATLVGFLLIGLLRNKIFIAAVILIVICWNTILPQKVIERMQYTEHEGELDKSAANRLIYWQQSLDYFKSSPLFGIGFDSFHFLGLKVDTHNLYIRTLAEQGIVGLGFLMSILILAFNRGLRLFKNAKDRFLKGFGLGFTACVAAVIVGNFFGDRWSHQPLGAYFWVFLAMVERGLVIVREESNQAIGNVKINKLKKQ